MSEPIHNPLQAVHKENVEI